MLNLRKIIEKINISIPFCGEYRYNEYMSAHTTFRVGGPADLWIQPRGDSFPVYSAALLAIAREEGIPVFILGGGANVVFADAGFRGIVLDSGGWTGCRFGDCSVTIRSGTRVDDAIEEAAGRGLSGLEFLAGMPGSCGGAIWMNARCYGFSVSDILMETEILDEALLRVIVPFRAEDYDYKKSPFQERNILILEGTFRLEKKAEPEIRSVMESRRSDREQKGHYRYPSAGSSFKNNSAFGKPTGKIIDELGFRGLSRGGARVADWHGNIIINTGNASAADIRGLTEDLIIRVKSALGIELEPEILFAGDWGE